MDNLSTSLQENLVVILAYNEEHCKTIRNIIPNDMFEGAYYEIVRRVYNHIDQYDRPPKEHLNDLFTDIIEGDDDSRKEMYIEILSEIGSFESKIQVDFTMKSIKEFMRLQNQKQAVLKAANLLHSGDPQASDEVDSILAGISKLQIDLFDAGTKLTDFNRSLRFLDEEEEAFPMGIKELDERGLCPTRKQLFLFIGLPKAGKSTFLGGLCANTALHGNKACHISLEMSEDRMSARYFASTFGITKRDEPYVITNFEKGDDGELVGFDTRKIRPKITFCDDDIRSTIVNKATALEDRLDNLIIKEFPTNSLTIQGLKAYLDMLENSHFKPDLLIVDYADIMKIPTQDYRIALGQVYKDLRGIAAERNIAVVTASQSNREGAKSKKLTDANVSEDYSKIFTADTTITYNQTEAEKELGLARLFVADARNDADKFTVLISQNYAMNQFCRDSYLMDNNYWDILGGGSGE